MTVSDEELMALVDGECPAEERAALEARIMADAELARRYAAQRALRERLTRCFDAALTEPVPQRLLDAATGRRARRAPPVWIAAAASLAAGLVLGTLAFKVAGPAVPLTLRDGQLTAGGALADVLSRQLAADQSRTAPLRVGVSFVAKTGRYCRTFIDLTPPATLAGLACREGGRWRVHVLESRSQETADRAAYAQAASPLPPSVLSAAEALMEGAPLDATAEAAARARDWDPSRSLPRER